MALVDHMFWCKFMSATIVLLLVGNTPAFAQEPSRLGLAIGAPAHAGLHVVDVEPAGENPGIERLLAR